MTHLHATPPTEELPAAPRMARRWRRYWHDPDPMLAGAGARGELLVAQARLVLTGLLLLTPVASILIDSASPENRVGLGISLCASLLALGTWQIVREGRQPWWIGIATTLFDVSLVTACHLAFALVDQPLIAVNARVVYETYFLAIFLTCLRYDIRLCYLAGVMAVLQYGAMSWWVASAFDLDAAAALDDRYGRFDWATQVSRLILLAAAAILSAVVVYKVRSLRRLSAIDRMTGLFNRGHFDERLEAELFRALRSGSPLSVAMLDVDRFKQFNDRHGHAAGDAALRAVAALARRMTRRSDVVARYGGEEIVFILPDTTSEQALEKLERIRAEVEAMPLPLPREEDDVRITVSAGIATVPMDGMSADAVLDEADARLFRAKAAGRNRVVGRHGSTAGRPRTSGPAERLGA